jgi:FixJ family two-component response regulator
MPAITVPKNSTNHDPLILVVDDELDTVDIVQRIVESSVDCKVIKAASYKQASEILRDRNIDLLVTDLHLPDGDGMGLIGLLQEKTPTSGAVVMTGDATVSTAIRAFRAGSFDFLPKPFSAELLSDRVETALKRQKIAARTEKRLGRLKTAVRQLNLARHTVSKKVDLLCNDLVGAYGELARQMDNVRTVESYRKLLNSSHDLEQMLCHSMDWILKNLGYCNVAVYLAGESKEYELGAYMKYTIQGTPQLTDAMKHGIVPLSVRENIVHIPAVGAAGTLTPVELQTLAGQTILASNCLYLGESLASMVLFRDSKTPFSDADKETVKAISSIFATCLAAIVRREEGEDGDETPLDLDEPPVDPSDEDLHHKRHKRKKGRRDEADWWKNGENPPF